MTVASLTDLVLCETELSMYSTLTLLQSYISKSRKIKKAILHLSAGHALSNMSQYQLGLS